MAFEITKPVDKELLLHIEEEIRFEANEPVFSWDVGFCEGCSFGIDIYTGRLLITPTKLGEFTVRVIAKLSSSEVFETTFKLHVQTLRFKIRPGSPHFALYRTLESGRTVDLDFTNEEGAYMPETLEEWDICEEEDERNADLELHA